MRYEDIDNLARCVGVSAAHRRQFAAELGAAAAAYRSVCEPTESQIRRGIGTLFAAKADAEQLKALIDLLNADTQATRDPFPPPFRKWYRAQGYKLDSACLGSSLEEQLSCFILHTHRTPGPKARGPSNRARRRDAGSPIRPGGIRRGSEKAAVGSAEVLLAGMLADIWMTYNGSVLPKVVRAGRKSHRFVEFIDIFLDVLMRTAPIPVPYTGRTIFDAWRGQKLSDRADRRDDWPTVSVIGVSEDGVI